MKLSTRLKISKGHVAWNKGRPAWNKGISPSQATRLNMSEAHRGKTFTTAHRLHLSEAQISRRTKDGSLKVKKVYRQPKPAQTQFKFSAEHRRRIGLAMIGNQNSLGVKRSLATRKLMSRNMRGIKHIRKTQAGEQK